MPSEIRLDGRVALVTGAGRGLGRSHALELAGRGARVVVNDLGCGLFGEGADDSVAAEVVREIEAMGGEAVANTLTIDQPANARAMVAQAVDRFGRLDIVVNNAGFLRRRPFLDHSEDMDRDFISVLVFVS
jgi:NAD(P)-dependent dehydrogenase (short-subunit alcohol dehydrogenase family)